MKERVIPSVYYGVSEPKTNIINVYWACANHLRDLLCKCYPRYIVGLTMKHDFPNYYQEVMTDYASSIDLFYK